jgi:hypothetical protein
VIRRLYDENEIKLVMGTEKGSVRNTIGVKQGDVAAVLFIVVMQAMAETLTPL